MCRKVPACFSNIVSGLYLHTSMPLLVTFPLLGTSFPSSCISALLLCLHLICEVPLPQSYVFEPSKLSHASQ